MRRNSAENRKWLSVRSYLCGDEYNSVLAEKDLDSVLCSEVTVSQSIQEDLNDKGDTNSEETVENVTQERPNSISKSLNEDEAAILIQSAFREFLVSSPNFNYINFLIVIKKIYLHLSKIGIEVKEIVESIFMCLP